MVANSPSANTNLNHNEILFKLSVDSPVLHFYSNYWPELCTLSTGFWGRQWNRDNRIYKLWNVVTFLLHTFWTQVKQGSTSTTAHQLTPAWGRGETSLWFKLEELTLSSTSLEDWKATIPVGGLVPSVNKRPWYVSVCLGLLNDSLKMLSTLYSTPGL